MSRPTRAGLASASGLHLLARTAAFVLGLVAALVRHRHAASTDALLVAGVVLIALGAWVAGHPGGARRMAPLVIWAILGVGAQALDQHRDCSARLLRGWRARGFVAGVTPVGIAGRIEDLERLPDDRVAMVVRLQNSRVPAGGAQMEPTPGVVRLRIGVPLPATAALPWREGDGIETTARVMRAHRFRNPGSFDYPRYLEARGIQLTGTVKSVRLFRHCVTPSRAWESLLPDLRRRLVASLERSTPRDRGATSAFLAALLVGERQSLPPALEEALQRSGVYHIIALSGFNVALVMLACAGLLSMAPLPWRGRLVALLVAVALFWGVVRGGGSIARAALMVMVHLFGRLTSRRVSAAGSVSVSALLILGARPAWIEDAGFQLSYAATLGLLATARPGSNAGGPARSAVHGVLDFVLVSLRASVGALCATAPFSARHFHQLTPAALLANLVVGPIAALSLFLAGGIVLAEPLAPGAAGLLGIVAARLLSLLRQAATFCAALPGGFLYVLPPPFWLLAPAGAGLIALSLSRRPAVRRAAAILLVVCCAMTVARGRFQRPTGRLEVTVLDVGQGDAVLVRFPDGFSLLIDAGGMSHGDFDIGARVVGPALRSLGLLRLDLLAITHAHRDHIGGAASIMRQFHPDAVWLGSMPRDDAAVRRLEALAASDGSPVVSPRRGVRLSVGGARLEVLHPVSLAHRGPGAANGDSLVLRIAFGDRDVLLTGDMEGPVEDDLVRSGRLLHAEVLKVGHHGSATSSGERFLEAVAPRLALVSVGASNPWGHPAPEVVRRLARHRSRVLRTDRDGAVSVRTDGRSPWRVTVLTEDGSSAGSEKLRGHGEEADDEDDAAENGQCHPARAERSDLVNGARVTDTEDREQHPEQHQVIPATEPPPAAEQRDSGARDDAMRTRREGEQHMPPVELTYRQQVERGGEQPQPRGGEGGVQVNRDIRSDRKKIRIEPVQEKTGGESHLARSRRLGRHRRVQKAVEQDRQCDHEPCYGSGHADIEQGSAIGERGANANDRAESPEKIRPGEEEGERGVDPVEPAGDVVPHFVGAQDQKYCGGIGPPGTPVSRMTQELRQGGAGDRGAARHERSGDEGCYAGQNQADQIDQRMEGAAWTGAVQLPEIPQVFAGLEADGLAGGDAHLGAGARIAADPLLPGLHLEDPEAAQLDTLAAAHRFLHGIQDGLDRNHRSNPGDIGYFGDIINDIGLNHSWPLQILRFLPKFNVTY